MVLMLAPREFYDNLDNNTDGQRRSKEILKNRDLTKRLTGDLHLQSKKVGTNYFDEDVITKPVTKVSTALPVSFKSGGFLELP